MRNLFLMFVLAFVATACTTTHYSRDGEKVKFSNYSMAWDRDKVDFKLEKEGQMKGRLKINGSRGSDGFSKAVDGTIAALESLKAGAR